MGESDRAATFRVLAEIAAERDHQIDRHGHDPDKDDKQPMSWWGWLLARRATDLSCPVPLAIADSPRRQLLEIAAIAVAALESLDRRPTEPEDPAPPTPRRDDPPVLEHCICGYPAVKPSEHRGGCPYSGYPEITEHRGHMFFNPHWLTVTDESELVVSGEEVDGMQVIVAAYNPATEELDAFHYKPLDRPWSPYPPPEATDPTEPRFYPEQARRG